MKKTVLNIGAIIIAFIIGLTINGACAGSLDNMTDTELRKLVAQLQQEVNSLKQQVAQLENQVSGFENSLSLSLKTTGFDVDGIHFNNSGFPESKIDYGETNGYIISDGVRTEFTPTVTKYEYDTSGRVVKKGQSTYSYSGKTYTAISETQSGSNLTHLESVFHLK